MPTGGHSRRIQLDEFFGNLAGRPSCFAFGLCPVRAAHFGKGRDVTADVLADLIELVGGDKEPVAGATTFGWRKL